MSTYPWRSTRPSSKQWSKHSRSGSSYVRPRSVRTPPDAVPNLILFQNPASERIDVLIVKTEFEESALQRAQRTSAYGLPDLPVVTAEDLIVFKLLASRPRDLADAEEVARSQERAGRALDWSYVEKHCAEWGVDAQLAALRTRLGF